MTIDVMGQFRRTRTAVWATTYTFEPGLLDDYIFRHLGEPPLNVNILVDGRQIDRLWERWAEDPWRLRRVNRDYLVRPVHLGSCAFHPKTYLLAGKSGGTLLVGSGNLSMNGLARGQEVFCEFDPTTDEGRAAIASWRQWMDRLVRRLGDHVLTKRWIRFLADHPWLPSIVTPSSPLVHNLDRSILDQLIDRLPGRVDELHLLAPFYDHSCYALTQILARVVPRSATIYLPEDVSIDGQRLTQVIAEAPCGIRLCQYSESEYVHAKVIGCIAGEQGVILSGSPNLSKPALCETVDIGNSEVAIIAETSPEVVRSTFLPEGWATVDVSPAATSHLELRHQHEPAGAWPVSLTSATKGSDGRVRVRYLAKGAAGLDVVSGVQIGNLVLEVAGTSTLRTLPSDNDARLAWLAGSDGQQVSNRVPLDDEASLDGWLEVRAGQQDAPGGLRERDLDSDVGRMLDELNRTFIFDIEEIVARSRAAGAENEAQSEDDMSAFWDSFDSEMVQFDPRAQIYIRGLHGQPELTWLDDQELLSTLESMVGRFPGYERLSYQHAGVGHIEHDASPNPNIQIRVGNVLSRWSKALDDTRFHWVDVTAPVLNYRVLLIALQTCRLRQYLRHDRLASITLTLLQSFVGSDKRPGYLLSLEPADRERALARLDDATRELGAAMIYAAMPPSSSWRNRVFGWQSIIATALVNGVVWAGERSVEVLDAFISAPGADPAMGSFAPSKTQIDDHLQLLATFINDEQWCLLQEEELGLSNVELRQVQGQHAQFWPYHVKVTGVAKLRVEPRIVSLVNDLLAYKNADGVVIEAAEVDGTLKWPQRLTVSLVTDETISAMDRDGTFVAVNRIGRIQLRELEQEHRSFSELLVPAD